MYLAKISISQKVGRMSIVTQICTDSAKEPRGPRRWQISANPTTWISTPRFQVVGSSWMENESTSILQSIDTAIEQYTLSLTFWPVSVVLLANSQNSKNDKNQRFCDFTKTWKVLKTIDFSKSRKRQNHQKTTVWENHKNDEIARFHAAIASTFFHRTCNLIRTELCMVLCTSKFESWL